MKIEERNKGSRNKEYEKAGSARGVAGDTLHDGSGVLEEIVGPHEVCVRAADGATLIPGGLEVPVDQLREKALWPMGVCSVTGGIHLPHLTPDGALLTRIRNLIPCDFFV